MRRLLWLPILASTILAGYGRLAEIDYSPRITPEGFLAAQHWVRLQLGGSSFVLSQPSSSLIVYFVSLFDLFVAWKFLSNLQGQKSRLWWGIGLVLTGVGALLAGTSYQAFGYEIKCSGREFCTWTSWWEILYMLLSGPGMSAFLIACAYSNASGGFRRILIGYAALNSIAYAGLLLYGAFVPIRFLVSFEFLMAVSTPTVLFFVGIYTRAFARSGREIDRSLRNIWWILIGVIAAYVVSLASGLTQILWSRGIWFTENDVLHVGMIYWVYRIWKTLPQHLKDAA